MTFEEFFKKKRIDLAALQSGEPLLFSEFKTHYQQMGEKSFDHTKKYWFNKLRLTYHLAPEQKPEKIRMENRLAEQTITESLLEEKIVPPSVGFKPKFKAGMTGKPAEASIKSAGTAAVVNTPAAGDKVQPADAAAPKPAGFKARFNMKMAAPKPETEDAEPATEEPREAAKETGAVETTASKTAGFKPGFNTKTVVPKPAESEEQGNQKTGKGMPAEEATAESAQTIPEAGNPAETPALKPAGFKPRFNMKMVKPKPPEEE